VTQWHTDIHKRKRTGGRRGPHRKKRRFERGRDMMACLLGEPERVRIRTRGGGLKQALKSERYANVYDPSIGRVVRAEIIGVKANPANRDFQRRGLITRGAIIETRLGDARVTSSPGSDGVVNAVLLKPGPAGPV